MEGEKRSPHHSSWKFSAFACASQLMFLALFAGCVEWPPQLKSYLPTGDGAYLYRMQSICQRKLTRFVSNVARCPRNDVYWFWLFVSLPWEEYVDIRWDVLCHGYLYIPVGLALQRLFSLG